MSLPEASILLSTYNWPEALELVLKSVWQQSQPPLEILVADDGSTEETRQLIDTYRSELPVPLKHIWHEDKGFRKTIIMNKAVREAAGKYIIQIDGDIILHPDFIRDHLKAARENFFIKGSRGMLSPEKSRKLLQSGQVRVSSFGKGVRSKINATRFPLLSPLFYGSPSKTNDLRGCNFAFWKEDFIAVNGYNNDLTGWGHEDIELAARLVNQGVRRKQLKMTAVCYHLYHIFQPRHDEDNNYQIYEKTGKEDIKRCPNGYDQIRDYPAQIR